MVESRPVGINRVVAGSSPASGASFFMFFVYILENSEGLFYTGHTDDLETRLASHNRIDKTSGKFTRKNGPWKLVWSEAHPTRPEAARRERQIKQMKSARWIREHLLNGRVPTRRD
jgi:putative endonuclease